MKQLFKSVQEMVRCKDLQVGDICSAPYWAGTRIRNKKKHRSKWKRSVYTTKPPIESWCEYEICAPLTDKVDGGSLVDLSEL